MSNGHTLQELSPPKGLNRGPTGNQKAGALPSLGAGTLTDATQHQHLAPLGGLGENQSPYQSKSNSGPTSPGLPLSSDTSHVGGIPPLGIAPPTSLLSAPAVSGGSPTSPGPPRGGHLAPLNTTDIGSDSRSHSGSGTGGVSPNEVMAGSPVLARRQRNKIAAAANAEHDVGSPNSTGSPQLHTSFGAPGSNQLSPNMHDILDPHVDATEVMPNMDTNQSFGNVMPPPVLSNSSGPTTVSAGNVLAPPALQQEMQPRPPGSPHPPQSPTGHAGRAGLAPLEKTGLSSSAMALQSSSPPK